MKKILAIMIALLIGSLFEGNQWAQAFGELDDVFGIEIHGFISQGFLKSDDPSYERELQLRKSRPDHLLLQCPLHLH